MTSKVEIKFENKIYRAELPDLESFTGQLSLTFHLKEGVLMKADISKSTSTVDLSPKELVNK